MPTSTWRRGCSRTTSCSPQSIRPTSTCAWRSREAGAVDLLPCGAVRGVRGDLARVGRGLPGGGREGSARGGGRGARRREFGSGRIAGRGRGAGEVVVAGDRQAAASPGLVQRPHQGGVRVSLRVQWSAARRPAGRRAHQGGRARGPGLGDERHLHVDAASRGVRPVPDRGGPGSADTCSGKRDPGARAVGRAPARGFPGVALLEIQGCTRPSRVRRRPGRGPEAAIGAV